MLTIDIYCRVSTDDQNLQRQTTNTLDHVDTNFDVDLSDHDFIEVAEYIDDNDGVTNLPVGDHVTIHADKSTGTNTDRSGYRCLMDRVENEGVDVVVANSVSRVCRSIQDLERTATRITEDCDAELHIVKQGFQLAGGDDDDPYQRAMFRLLGVFAELEAEIRQQNTREGIRARMNSDEDYSHGPAPLGFEKDNGRLLQASNYHDVVATLEMVQEDELSKRRAARELGTSRKSIYRALERAALYGLGNTSQEVGGDA